MINPKLLNSLTDVIDKWANDNCEEDWWLNSVGYVSDDCFARLAKICALTLEESKLGQDIATE